MWQLTYILLGTSEFDDTLLDCPASTQVSDIGQHNGYIVEGDIRNKSVHRDLLGLTHSMSSVHCLSIVRGIPIMVVYMVSRIRSKV